MECNTKVKVELKSDAMMDNENIKNKIDFIITDQKESQRNSSTSSPEEDTTSMASIPLQDYPYSSNKPIQEMNIDIKIQDSLHLHEQDTLTTIGEMEKLQIAKQVIKTEPMEDKTTNELDEHFNAMMDKLNSLNENEVIFVDHTDSQRNASTSSLQEGTKSMPIQEISIDLKGQDSLHLREQDTLTTIGEMEKLQIAKPVIKTEPMGDKTTDELDVNFKAMNYQQKIKFMIAHHDELQRKQEIRSLQERAKIMEIQKMKFVIKDNDSLCIGEHDTKIEQDKQDIKTEPIEDETPEDLETEKEMYAVMRKLVRAEMRYLGIKAMGAESTDELDADVYTLMDAVKSMSKDELISNQEEFQRHLCTLDLEGLKPSDFVFVPPEHHPYYPFDLAVPKTDYNVDGDVWRPNSVDLHKADNAQLVLYASEEKLKNSKIIFTPREKRDIVDDGVERVVRDFDSLLEEQNNYRKEFIADEEKCQDDYDVELGCSAMMDDGKNQNQK